MEGREWLRDHQQDRLRRMKNIYILLQQHFDYPRPNLPNSHQPEILMKNSKFHQLEKNQGSVWNFIFIRSLPDCTAAAGANVLKQKTAVYTQLCCIGIFCNICWNIIDGFFLLLSMDILFLYISLIQYWRRGLVSNSLAALFCACTTLLPFLNNNKLCCSCAPALT